MLAAYINFDIAGYHFIMRINFKGLCLDFQALGMLYCGATARRTALVQNHLIRINFGMMRSKEIFAVLTGQLFHFTGFIVKVIMAPGSLCFAGTIYQLATLQQPDIAGFHIALDLRCINILTVLRYLDIALGMKITADSIIFGMFTGQTNRQHLLLFCIQLFTMRYRCIRFINSYRA